MAAHHPDLPHTIWRKGTYRSSTGQNRVEVATNLPGVVEIRDSNDPEVPKLLVLAAERRAFVGSLKSANTPRSFQPQRRHAGGG